MTQPKLKSVMALAVLAMTLGAITTAYGQYQTIGTTAGGGNIVVGNGLLGRIASGASTGFLTGGGSDYVTLNLGSFATTNSYGATIKFGTPNDTLLNYGTINGGSSSGGTDGGNAVSFLSNNFLFNGSLGTETITNETVVNHGNIFGAESNDAEIVGNAVSFLATGEINGVSFTNIGIVEGANNSFSAFIAGSALNFASENSDITNVTVFNSGNLTGGNDDDEATAVGSGISMVAGNGITNVGITNAQGGNILGGNAGNAFSDSSTLAVGNGIVLLDENNNFKDINNVSTSNSGNILGGNDNFGDGAEFDSSYFISNGIGVGGFGNISNLNFTNTSTGVIQGGNDNDDGWFIGTGIGVGAISQDGDAGGGINNVTLNNAGLVQGGHGNDGNEQGVEAGTGVAIVGGTSVNNVTINNKTGGRILGGDDNFDANSSAGSGIDITSVGGIQPLAPGIGGGTVSNVMINNWGFIGGGSGNRNAFYVANGIGISSNTLLNITINNAFRGTIAGGNANFSESFDTGAGIALDANTINGVAINNWGLVRGGNNIAQVESSSYGGDGIDIEGNNLSNISIFNAFTGVITGGVGGGTGIFISGESDPANVSIYNLGWVLGGDGDAISGRTDGGAGIEFDAPNDNTNILIVNFGWVQGGNGVAGGVGGTGIIINGNNTDIENWGVIAGGLGGVAVAEGTAVKSAVTVDSVADAATFRGDAIEIDGSGNVVNLNGHSAVLGKISLTGPANSNVVNLNFTGVNVLTMITLRPLLLGQGVNSGADANSVTFTLRGVTYDIDPAIVNWNLSSYQLQGITPNQSAVGASLDSATSNPPPGSPLFNLYNAIDMSGNVPGALEQLSPQMYQIYGDIALAIANFNTLEIDHRLNNLRDGSESIDTTGIGGENTAALTSGLSKDDGKDVKDRKGVVETTPEPKYWGFFASGNAIFTDIDAHGGDLQKSGFTTDGLMVGVDGKVHENWLVGTFFDYEHTSADMDNQGSQANVDSYTGGLYTGYHNEGYYGNGLFAYTHNDYNSHRNIFIPGFNQAAAGNTSGNQFELNLDGGYDFHMNDRVTWGPILGMQYVHMDVDGFNETGASAANLAVGSQNMDSLRSRAGMRIDYHRQIARQWAFATEVRAEWQHEFLDDSRGIGASFIGDGLAPFSVQTTNPQRDAALVGVGVDFTMRDRWTFFFDYDAQAGQQSYIEQSVKGGLKFSF